MAFSNAAFGAALEEVLAVPAGLLETFSPIPPPARPIEPCGEVEGTLGPEKT
ncbi:MAG: hypothetical protein ABSG70_09910 [Terriglobales bacterium]